MRMRALDNVGAYAGRSPLQLGKPVGAIVGPYRIGAVAYHAIAVTTNKTPQEAVRGFGQSPTNYAIETGIDRVAEALGLDRLEVRRRNFIRAEEFPYLIPSGTTYDSGDYHAVVAKTLDHADWEALVAERDRLRAAGLLAGIGVAELPGAQRRQLVVRAAAQRQEHDHDLDGILPHHGRCAGHHHAHHPHHLVRPGPRDAGRDRRRRGAARSIPTASALCAPTSLESLPGNSPVGSRMAIMLGGAVHQRPGRAARQADRDCRASAGRRRRARLTLPQRRRGGPPRPAARWNGSTWCTIAHRHFHLLPPGMEPGIAVEPHHAGADGRRAADAPTAACRCIPATPSSSTSCWWRSTRRSASREIRRYVIGHDCGTVINPDIVRGMTLGGIAHGIGAALLEEFAFDGEGQLVTQSFMDYLLPSAHEVPEVEIVHHVTPSPHTVLGQKGSGESGYLGAPAALSSAINDAVRHLGHPLRSRCPCASPPSATPLPTAMSRRAQGGSA